MFLESMQFLVSGAAFGAAGGVSPGPTTTLVIAQTLRHGLREGLKVAIAPLLTDTPIILVSLLLTRQVSADPLLALISFVGAAFLLYLAYESFTAKPLDLTPQDVKPGSIGRGMLANFFNPHPWIFWLTVGGPTMQRALDSSALAALLFLVGQYTLLVGAKMAIAVIVDRGRKRLGSGYLYVMKFLGIVLVTFSILFMREALQYLGWL